ncbi:MAG: tetratricopeptide repeat protein [Fimbriimonas sp.]
MPTMWVVALGLLMPPPAGLPIQDGRSGPRCLILQTLAKPNRDDVDLNVRIDNFLANEMDGVGKVVPVVYGPSDPIFRTALEKGQLKKAPEVPSLEEAKAIAKELKADFLLVVESVRSIPDDKAPEGKVGDRIVSGGGIAFVGRLYRGPKEIWSDKRTFPASSGTAFDANNNARTVARTTYLVLDAGPWKSLAARSKVETPTVDPGQLAPTTRPAPTVSQTARTRPFEVATPFADVEKAVSGFVKAGDIARALSFLRSEIDATPLDLDRRVLYVDTLIGAKMGFEAIDAAQGAAQLFPDRIDLRVRAARAALDLGELPLAQTELSEAVIRSPKDPEVRLLLSQIALMRGEPKIALSHLAAMEARPTDAADVALLGRLANALEGRADAKGSLVLTGAQYARVGQILDESAALLAERIRTLHQRAIVRRADPEVAAQNTQIAKIVAATGSLVREITAPDANKKSHLPRALAWSLLAQSMGDFALYLKDGDEDSITESRINLGEAIKNLTSARRLLLDERNAAAKGS